MPIKESPYTLTLRQLRDYIEETKYMSDDTEVLYHRIEDVYFEEHGWETEDFPSAEFPGEVDKFISAFCVYTGKKKGKFCVLISAHY